MYSDRLEEIDEEYTSEEEEDASSMSSSPSIPDENINFDLVYALHTFVATVEGQASVVKGDALILMEDTNIYWWLVEVIKTREVGYIPAENIEVNRFNASCHSIFTDIGRHRMNDWLD
jgi:hypothetical protein